MSGPPDFRERSALEDPYPGYAWLRDHDPVHWSEDLRAWVITRYDDVVEVFDRPARFSSDRFRKVDARYASQRPAVREVASILGEWMVFRDAPDHTRLRALLQKSFTTRQLERTRPEIERTIETLLDAMAARGAGDFIEDFAFPLPAMVIAVLLGVPPGDLEQLKRWSDEMSAYVGGSLEPIDNFDRTREGLAAMVAYFRDLIAVKRRNPDDALISMMLAAEEAGDKLSADEVVSNCVLLLFAGHETTTNLIANGLHALLERDDQMALLHANRERMPDAIEEFLRFEAPVPATNKVALESFEWHGSRIAAGDKVLPFISAANRDPRKFEDPDRLDITRSPNRHLAFTYGIHFCLGAPLARLEARLGLEALLARFPKIELEGGAPAWRPLLFFRALERLPIRFA